MCGFCKKLRDHKKQLEKIEAYVEYFKQEIAVTESNRIDWNGKAIKVKKINFDVHSDSEENDHVSYQSPDPEELYHSNGSGQSYDLDFNQEELWHY